MKELEKARVKLLLNYPFYAYLAIHLEEREDKDLPTQTMGTDGRRLYYDPTFVKSLKPDELVFVLAHEVGHCALLHIGKSRMGNRTAMVLTQGGPIPLWNLACDYAVNALLVADKLTPPKSILYDKQYDGMSAEQIYAKLLVQAQHGGGAGVGVICPDDTPAPGKAGPGPLDDHTPWGKEGKEKKAGSEASGEVPEAFDEETWRGRVAAAANQAKMQGKLPAHLEQLVEDVVHPRLDWRVLLREFVHVTMAKTDYRLFPANRRHIWQGLYLPSSHGERVDVAVAIDTSGSIGDQELQMFLGEIRGIADSFGDYCIHVLQCDATVHSHDTIEPYNQEFPSKVLGRGGTDFRPVFDYIAEKGLDVPCLVYLTDGYGSFPDVPPPYPVLWCITNEQVTAPFGQTVRLLWEDER